MCVEEKCNTTKKYFLDLNCNFTNSSFCEIISLTGIKYVKNDVFELHSVSKKPSPLQIKRN